MIRTSESTAELAAALSAAQGEMPTVPKTKTGKVSGQSKSGSSFSYEYKYADISDVLATALPVLSRHGLSIMQVTAIADNALWLVTRLSHSSGQWVESDYPVASLGGDHQKMGGALTYAKRYNMCALIGVAAEEDTDAHGLDNGPQRRTARDPAKDLKREVIRFKDADTLLEFMTSDHVQQQMQDLPEAARTEVRILGRERLAALGYVPPEKPKGGDSTAEGAGGTIEAPKAPAAAPGPSRRRKDPEASPPPAGSLDEGRADAAGSPSPNPQDPAADADQGFATLMDPDEVDNGFNVVAWFKDLEEALVLTRTLREMTDVMDNFADGRKHLTRSENEHWSYLIQKTEDRILSGEKGQLPAPDQADPLAFKSDFANHDDYEAYMDRAIEAATQPKPRPEALEPLRKLWFGNKEWRDKSGYTALPRRDELAKKLKVAFDAIALIEAA